MRRTEATSRAFAPSLLLLLGLWGTACGADTPATSQTTGDVSTTDGSSTAPDSSTCSPAGCGGPTTSSSDDPSASEGTSTTMPVVTDPGDTSDTGVDVCAPNPCLHDGTCIAGMDGYTCECAPGFSGPNCETDIDDCAGEPCLNGGTCIDGVDGFTCECAPGFTGPTCETDIDDCAPNPCLNGGTCTDAVNGYTCECAPTYTGENCDACTGTLADCNADPVDGCEINLQSSADHCNACGDACAEDDICSNGDCKPPPAGQVPGVPIDVPATHTPLAPAVADIDKDGKLDILVANAESGSAMTPSGSLSVFLGNGDATVQAEVNYPGAPPSSNASSRRTWTATAGSTPSPSTARPTCPPITATSASTATSDRTRPAPSRRRPRSPPAPRAPSTCAPPTSTRTARSTSPPPA